MGKPIIGLSPLYNKEQSCPWMLPRYMSAVMAGGGVPLILPFTESESDFEEIVKRLDGFLFTGGPDLDPAVYGQEKEEFCGEISRERDILEKILLEKVLKHKKPFLGICRGIQAINVFLGGSLYQDIASQTEPETKIAHLQEKPYDKAAHSVKVLPGTPFYELIEKDELLVNSIHHQAILKLAPGLVPAAFAPDGIIEAVYMPEESFAWAVQWHPEHMYLMDETSLKIFKAFADACK